MVAPSTAMSSPEEDEKEQTEQDSRLESQISKTRQTLRRVSNSLTPEEAEIMTRWAKGKTLQQIASETGSSTATVQRKLTKLQKAYVNELGVLIVELGKTRDKEVAVAHLLEKLKEHRAKGFRALVASSLTETARRDHAPRIGL